MRRLLTPDQFAVDTNARDGAAVYRFATATADLTDVTGRSVAYRFSGGAVARDNHTIDQDGWKLDNFLQNPQFLWMHDDRQLPVGKVTDLGVIGGWLRGRVEYIERDVYPFADTVFQMVKKGFLSAVSTAWLPIEWQASRDKSRPGGIDFLSQELLEISQVTIPAQPDALAEARAAGIDTGPIFEWAGQMLDRGGYAAIPRNELELLRKAAKMPVARKTRSETEDWKVGAARDLAIGEDKDWDGPAAAKAIFTACDFDGDKPDTAMAAKYFLVHDAENPTLKGSYKFPFAEKDGDTWKAMPAGIRACASRLPDSDLPQAVKDDADAVVKAYEKKMGEGKEKQATRTHFVRGLCEVSQLAWLLDSLSWMQDCVQWEADVEQDGSDIPERLLDVLNTVGLILVDMTKEEVAELIASKKPPEEVDVDAVIEQSGKTRGQAIVLNLAAMARMLKRTSPAATATMTRSFDPAEIARHLAVHLRAGKKISAANKEVLTQAMEHHRAMGECIQSLLDQADDEPKDDAAAAGAGANEQAATAERARRAQARLRITERKLKTAA